MAAKTYIQQHEAPQRHFAPLCRVALESAELAGPTRPGTRQDL